MIFNKGSTLFCSGLHIVDFSRQCSIYYLSAEPVLDKAPSGKLVKHAEHLSLDGGDWVHFAYYLNRGSLVTVTFTVTTGSAHFYLIQGKDNFQKWSEDPDENRNWLLSKYSSNSSPASSSSTVSTSDEYFLVFDNDKDYAATSLALDIRVNRTQYDLASHTPQCPAGSALCDLVIAYNDKRHVVFAAPALDVVNASDKAQSDKTYEMDVYSLPRWSGIVFFWLLVPSTFVLACWIVPAVVSYIRSNRSVLAEVASQHDGSVNAAVFASMTAPAGSSAAEYESVPGIELLDSTGFLVVAEVEAVSPGGGRPAAWASEVVTELPNDERSSEAMPLMGSVPAPSAPSYTEKG